MGSCWVVVMGGCGMLMGGCGRGDCGLWLCRVVVVSWSLWHLSPLVFMGGHLPLLVIVVGSCCCSSLLLWAVIVGCVCCWWW